MSLALRLLVLTTPNHPYTTEWFSLDNTKKIDNTKSRDTSYSVDTVTKTGG